MSCPDWNAIKKEYLTTSVSQRALAKKYKVSLNAIKRRSTGEGWVAARAQISHETTTKLVDKTSDLASEAKALLYETAMEMIRQLNALAKDGAYDGNLKPRDVTGAMKDCRDILDLKSDIDIEEQRARIDKLRREAQEEKNEPKSITVTIEGGGEGWAS